MSDEVIVPWIENTRLAARRSMVGATGNIYAGLHEFEDMMLLLHFLRADDLFLDIGANIGSFSVLASGVCAARSFAFEPDPLTVSFLERNLVVNGIQNLVEVNQCALGEKNGKVTFSVGRDSMNHIVAANQDSNVQIVKMVRLDDAVGDNQPAFIKMDVEGYEEQVILGALATLKQPSLRLIELETTSPLIQQTLAGCGFELGYYDPFKRKLIRKNERSTSRNSLYIRDWDFVTRRISSAREFRILGERL